MITCIEHSHYNHERINQGEKEQDKRERKGNQKRLKVWWILDEYIEKIRVMVMKTLCHDIIQGTTHHKKGASTKFIKYKLLRLGSTWIVIFSPFHYRELQHLYVMCVFESEIFHYIHVRSTMTYATKVKYLHIVSMELSINSWYSRLLAKNVAI